MNRTSYLSVGAVLLFCVSGGAGDSNCCEVIRDVEYARDAPVQSEVVHGAAHGGAAFCDAERLGIVKDFLRRQF
jgi:hypothetical protein